MRKIILIYGGPSWEHEVSIKSAQMIAANLNPHKYKKEEVKVHKDLTWEFNGTGERITLSQALEYITENAFDIALIAIHGEFGEDGKIQAILDTIGLPYVGSGVTSSTLAMDKGASNLIFQASGLNVPRFEILSTEKKEINLNLPVFVKPLHGGSSVGTKKVSQKEEIRRALKNAFKFENSVMVQECIEGRELTCGVLEKNGTAFALPPTEIIAKNSDFFDYEAKYTLGISQEITPPNLSESKIKELQELALRAHNALGCRGISRSDFILKDDLWYILETNTIPGMTETSLVPQEAKVAGISFSQMLDLLLESALDK